MAILAQDVLTKSAGYTGFGPLRAKKYAAELVNINQDDTPFIHNRISGQKVWVVSWSGSLVLGYASASETDLYPRNFKVYHDADTGQFLKACSIHDGEDADLLPEPSAALAEDQLRKSGEVYVGLPVLEPKISLLKALDLIYAKGIGSPYLAKEFVALLVLHSRESSPGRSCWVVSLRGIPPLIPRGVAPERSFNIPVWQRNHIRNVVDAETGDVLFANNVPQPH